MLVALESGQLAGAALDVFAAEPLVPEHLFAASPHKIVVTAHDACEVRVEAVAATLIATADAIRAGRVDRRSPTTVNAAIEHLHAKGLPGAKSLPYHRGASGIEGLRAASAIPEALAQKLAAEHYGLPTTAHRLDSERDQNFRLTTLDGREYILKIANPAEDPAVTNLQTEALLHLAIADPGLPIPRVFPTMNGAHELAIPFDDGSTRIVRLLSYMAGIPMHAVEGSKMLRRNLGRCAARLAKGLRNFRHAGAWHKLLWDLQHAAELRSLVDAVPADRRGLVEDCLDGFEARARFHCCGACMSSRFTTTSIHTTSWSIRRTTNAFRESSISVISGVHGPGQRPRHRGGVSGLPIATIPLRLPCELIAAYHGVTPLDAAEFDILFDLMATRMVMTIVISSWRARRYPENRNYILRNNNTSWARLIRIARFSRVQATQQIQRACNSE